MSAQGVPLLQCCGSSGAPECDAPCVAATPLVLIISDETCEQRRKDRRAGWHTRFFPCLARSSSKHPIKKAVAHH